MQLKHISAPFAVKAVNLEERTFEGYASIFDIEDAGGDIVDRGAFTKTINERVTAGKVKLLDHHQYGSTRFLYGKVLEAREDEAGLWTKSYVSDIQEGHDLLTKIKEGVVDALSFGYDVIQKSIEETETGVIRHLKELKLWEVSPVIWGMHPMALIDAGSVKSMQDIIDNLDGIITNIEGINKSDLTDEDRALVAKASQSLAVLSEKDIPQVDVSELRRRIQRVRMNIIEGVI